MAKKEIKIALDISGTSFIENYRIKAYHGVIRYAREHTSWKLMFNVAGFSLTNKFTGYDDLAKLGAEGLIFLNWDEQVLAEIKSTGLPAVGITDVIEGPGKEPFPCALSDDLDVGRMVAEHFLDRGFRHFGFCGSDQWIWVQRRTEGFGKRLKEEGFSFSFLKHRLGGDPDPKRDQARAKVIQKWLKNLPKPVGLMGENDTVALHLLEACQSVGLEVPNEVAIVGVDNNVMICDSLLPSLSSVEQNTERVGYEAAELLDKMLKRKEIKNKQVIVAPKGIITRMSSDVLAVEDQSVAKALVFIRDNLAQQIGIVDVVKASGVSRSNLETRFRVNLRCTINSEIRKRRLKRARSLLMDTLFSLEEIAELSGFRRATYFSNIFSASTGMSPGAWRRMHRIGL